VEGRHEVSFELHSDVGIFKIIRYKERTIILLRLYIEILLI